MTRVLLDEFLYRCSKTKDCLNQAFVDFEIVNQRGFEFGQQIPLSSFHVCDAGRRNLNWTKEVNLL